MTEPILDFEIEEPRSWIMESAGTSWTWLNVVAGKNGGSANMISLPAGVWMVTGTWRGNVPAEIRYQESGMTDPVIAEIIPAKTTDSAALYATQLPLKGPATVHVRTQGTATLGARLTLTASLFPLFNPGAP